MQKIKKVLLSCQRYYDVIARHAAIQIEPYSSGLLRSARNDGDLYRHHSFLQGIFHVLGAYNDVLRNPVIARDEAIQKQATQSGLLRYARNDGDLDGDLIVITLFCRGFFPCPGLAMTGL